MKRLIALLVLSACGMAMAAPPAPAPADPPAEEAAELQIMDIKCMPGWNMQIIVATSGPGVWGVRVRCPAAEPEPKPEPEPQEPAPRIRKSFPGPTA